MADPTTLNDAWLALAILRRFFHNAEHARFGPYVAYEYGALTIDGHVEITAEEAALCERLKNEPGA